MPEPERSRVMAIRTGERRRSPRSTGRATSGRRARAHVASPEPDRAAVDRFLVEAYRRAWGW